MAPSSTLLSYFMTWCRVFVLNTECQTSVTQAALAAGSASSLETAGVWPSRSPSHAFHRVGKASVTVSVGYDGRRPPLRGAVCLCRVTCVPARAGVRAPGQTATGTGLVGGRAVSPWVPAAGTADSRGHIALSCREDEGRRPLFPYPLVAPNGLVRGCWLTGRRGPGAGSGHS